MERRRYALGMVVQLKKVHPCGTDSWEITRTGLDFGLRCLGCGHRVMLPREKFERALKKVIAEAATSDPGSSSRGGV
ncbi:MAG: DUF951 domain-containing protein [Clostridia bacterium]